MFAEVAFPIRSFQTFTYSIPKEYLHSINIGSRVIVPLRNKTIQGVVVDVNNSISYSGNIKEIIEPVDNILIFTPLLWKLIHWVGKYYMVPIGKVANTVIPKSISKNYRLPKQKFVLLKQKIDSEILKDLKTRAPKQYAVYEILCSQDSIKDIASLKDIVKNPMQVCLALQKRGLIDIIEKDKIPDVNKFSFEPIHKKVIFNIDQQKVIDQIILSLNRYCYEPFLLHGVTGSGKTEIYIESVKICLEQNRTAIVLLPEIALTPQIAGRFRAVFGDAVAVWHSKLTQQQRSWTWTKICSGEYKIVIGARSAVFSPLKNIGLIIVDEEQESSFYQDAKDPRYHARDVAVMRGTLEKSVVIVASATPSLESYYNYQQKKFQYLYLPKRFGNAKYPTVHIVNMLSIVEETGKYGQVVSGLLQDKIEERINNNEQIILLQNRRGFSPIIKCNECGEVLMCNQCKIALTYHKNEDKLICHFCSYVFSGTLIRCIKCKNNKLKYFGTGTQKVESLIKQTFPFARVKRLDMDTSKSSNDITTLLKSFSNHEFDILIGTQMVAKGLDFPNATLVGIINADLGLHLPDFRASEKVFQLLYQASGRSGRSQKPGEVVIQTYSPDNIVINNAKKLNISKFYHTTLNEREELNYPPYSWLAKIEVIGSNRIDLISLMDRIAFNIIGKFEGLEVLGPSPCFLEKLKNKFRYQIVFKSKKILDPNGAKLHFFIKENFYNAKKKFNLKQNKLNIYFDPMSLI